MVVFFVQKTEREMFSKFFQCFVPRLLSKYGKSTGRLAPGSGYRKGSWKGHAKASAKRARSDRHARRGKARFFCAFPRGACLVLHARFALAFACPKNAKKITPVMRARFMVNVVRNSWRFLRQMNLLCRPYCCSSTKSRQNLFWDFNRFVLFQNNQNLQELYVGNNQLSNIREIFNLKVKQIYLNLCLAGFLKKLPPDRSLPSNSFFSPKVAIIKPKSATIAFFSSPPFFSLAFSFSCVFFFRCFDFGAYRAPKTVPFGLFYSNGGKFRYVITNSARCIIIFQSSL